MGEQKALFQKKKKKLSTYRKNRKKMKNVDIETRLVPVANLISAYKEQKKRRWDAYRTKKTTQVKVIFLTKIEIGKW